MAEVVPALFLDEAWEDRKVLSSKRFLVPYGKLSAGRGKREGQQTTSTMLKNFAESARQNIIRSNSAMSLDASLEIGLIGTGNKGTDSFVVLVEADGLKRDWLISIQSKQHVSDTATYETCWSILRAMETDLSATHALPQLPDAWKEWHKATSSDCSTMPPPPTCQAAASQWDDAKWDHRVIYAYVSDKISSSNQTSVRQELIGRQHPWIARVIIVGAADQAAWHSRTGALLRHLRLVVLAQKNVREGLWNDDGGPAGIAMSPPPPPPCCFFPQSLTPPA